MKAMTAENPALSTPPSQEENSIRKSKEQLLSAWEKLPAEHKATMALVLITDIMAGAYRPWLQSTMATQWPLQTGQLETAYPHLDITKDDLRQVHIEEEEIADYPSSPAQNRPDDARTLYLRRVLAGTSTRQWPTAGRIGGQFAKTLRNSQPKPVH